MNRYALRASMGKLLPVLALLAAVLAPQPALAQDGTCIDDVTERTNQCRANDVQLSTVMNAEDTTCMPGALVPLNLTVRLLATSQERYDIGIFLALDGGDARTGLCQHDYLRPPLSPGGLCSGSGDDCKKDADCPVGQTCIGGYIPGSADSDGGPFYDAEEAEDPGDLCGDLEQGVDTYYRLAPVEVPCIDSDGDGMLNISTAVSWDNQRTNTCSTLGDAVPNTPAKCRVGSVDVANVIVAPGLIQVEKSAEPEELLEPGGWVTYTFVVENTSPTIVTLETLDDSIYGPLEMVEGSNCSLPQTLDPGEIYTCTLSAQVIGEPGIYENVVIVSGTDGNKVPVSDADPAEVTIVGQIPDTGLGMPAGVVIGGMSAVGLALLLAGTTLRRRLA